MLEKRIRLLASHHDRMQHPGKLEVVDEAGATAEEARILEARHRLPDGAHVFARASAVARIASTMPRYPVHRQIFPEIAARTSSGVGRGFSCRNTCAVVRKPGVQKPHCSA